MRAADSMALRLWGTLELRLWTGGRATGWGGSTQRTWAICDANCQNAKRELDAARYQYDMQVRAENEAVSDAKAQVGSV